MRLCYGHNYDQDDPGWYIFDAETRLIVASSLGEEPTEMQLKEINKHKYLQDIYKLILRDMENEQ